MTSPSQRSILDYFSPSKTKKKEEYDNPESKTINQNSIQHEKAETPKKLKSTRMLVDIPESESSIENFSDSEVLKNDNSFIEKFENKCNVEHQIVHKNEKPRISEIISDYLDASINEFEDLDQNTTQKEKRYNFLLDIKDKNKKSKGEEGYDPTTLYIPPKEYVKFTPFEKQFWDIKREYFDTVIFFKKGKFYELYEDDAEIASRLFDLRVSARVNMKMAGVPESSYEAWAAKFVMHGYKIAKVDQSENAIGKKIREQDGKKDKIINREIKEIITPGTIYNNDYLQSCFPIYLAVLIQHNRCYSNECSGPCHFSILLYDSSINKIFVKTFCDSYDSSTLKTIFIQHEIKELITEEKISSKIGINTIKPVKSNVASSRRLDFSNDEEYECFSYLYNYMKALYRELSLESATVTNILDESDFMILDGATITNLDILANNFDFTSENTLFKAINYCFTPFGQRQLKKWIITPLKNIEKILERRNLASIFQSFDYSLLKNELKMLGDIERHLARLSSGTPGFKDLKLVLAGLHRLKGIFNLLYDILKEKDSKYANFTKEHTSFLDKTLKSFESTYLLNETEILPGSNNDELFLLNNKINEIKIELDGYLNKIKLQVNCPSLCFKSIGKEIFQIEAPNDTVFPQRFYVVSSTKNSKRYYSKELKEIIESFVETEERIFQSQNSIMKRAIDFLKTFNLGISEAISFIGSFDCLISFSIFNSSFKTVPPKFTSRLQIVNFTNPVYPNYIRNSFIPNSCITLVTGPNMGGKSTFLRSICLNIILAQMGMNVMCESMDLPVFDRIFTRIGASDSLARGESTFMVEMNEASKILKHSTKNSFVIIDELGRGTSTLDGEAIALAVLDQLKNIGCHTLFSTHYHRITHLCKDVDKSYVKCKLESDDITFLYKVEQGICADSHGLYVAKLAGIPESIIERAFEFKKTLN